MVTEWLARIGVQSNLDDDEPMVSLVDCTPPNDRIGRAIWMVLHDRGALREREVVRRVAEQLIVEDQRSGAWSVDVGLLGPALYARDVERALRTLRDRRVVETRIG